MELLKPFGEFLKDKSEVLFPMTTDGKAHVSYLEKHIFEKLCSLNKQIQGANARLCDAKTKIFGFVTFFSLCRNNILSKRYDQFPWLKDSKFAQKANTVIAEHLKMLINDFNKRFRDLKAVEFLLVDATTVSRFICCIKTMPKGII